MQYWWLISIILSALLVGMRIRSLFQRNFSLRHKLLSLSLLVGMASIAVTGWLATEHSTAALFEQGQQSLEAIRSARASQIEDKFRMIRAQVAEFARSTMTCEAVQGFSGGFHTLASEPSLESLDRVQIRDDLLTLHAKPAVNSSVLEPETVAVGNGIPNSLQGMMLQWLYSRALPERNFGELQCQYDEVHKKFHPLINAFLDSYGYNDVYLFDLDGNLVYSVKKAADLGTNFLHGPYSGSSLAHAFEVGRYQLNRGEAHLEDVAPYGPENNQYESFIVSPIFCEGRKIGVVAFQMPVERFGEIVRETIGMGTTGQLYLVGPDYRLRSDSRFSAVNTNVSRGAVSESARLALGGKTGYILETGYQGRPVLSAYQPLKIEGLNWAIIAEIAEEELFATANRLRDTVMSAAIATAVVVAILAFVFTTLLIHKQFENELVKSARIDKLTGLPNNELFHHRLKNLFERHQRNQNATFAVLFLDFDRFKMVNDCFGHAVGDLLLQEIANRLRSCIKPTDSLETDIAATTIARLGGDEFVVLLDTSRGQPSAQHVADRLLGVLNERYQLGIHDVRSTASIGVVLSDASYTDESQLIRDADTAMYEAKSRGKACSVMFDVSMQQEIQQRIRFENEIRKALDAKDFHLVFQPIVNLDDGSLSSVETLIRWKHEEMGFVSPAEFVPIAEDLGLVVEISEWVFETACKHQAEWKHAFGERAPKSVSVNLSQKHFSSGNLLDTVGQILGEYNLRPQELQMEITETAVMTDTVSSLNTLNSLKQLGVKIALDDFGTGHSTLAMLRDFPIDCVKIDRAFTAEAHASREMAALVHAVAVLSQNLGMDTVAEGIETQEDLLAVQKLGCAQGQGYFLGRPMTAAAFTEYLTTRTSNRTSTVGTSAFLNTQAVGMQLTEMNPLALPGSEGS